MAIAQLVRDDPFVRWHECRSRLISTFSLFLIPLIHPCPAHLSLQCTKEKQIVVDSAGGGQRASDQTAKRVKELPRYVPIVVYTGLSHGTFENK